MTWVLAIPLFLQSLLILIDEAVFHRKRGLSDWEVYGHPMDSLSVAVPFAVTILLPFSPQNLAFYLVLAAFSSFFVTKDEFLHADVCTPLEHWLHSLLFVLHPVVFMSAGWLWYQAELGWLLRLQFMLIVGFSIYQFAYWTKRREALGSSKQRNL